MSRLIRPSGADFVGDAHGPTEFLGDPGRSGPRGSVRALVVEFSLNTAKDTAENYYRINVFYPAVDTILRDLELRFGPKQKIAMNLSRNVSCIR